MASPHVHKRLYPLNPLEHQRQFELLLHDPSRMPYFLDFLMDLGGHNLLMFWLETEQFAEYTGNARDCLDRARGIVERHVGLTARNDDESSSDDEGRQSSAVSWAEGSGGPPPPLRTTLALTKRVRQRLRRAVSSVLPGSGRGNRAGNVGWTDDDEDGDWGDGYGGAGGSDGGYGGPGEDEDGGVDPEEEAVVGAQWGRFGPQAKPRRRGGSRGWPGGATARLQAAAHREATARLACATVNVFAEAQALAAAQVEETAVVVRRAWVGKTRGVAE